MTPVFPYLIRRSEDGWRGELLLRFEEGKSYFIIIMSLEQARALAVEMRGLATDHCPHHHLSRLVVEALGAKIADVVIRLLDPSGGVMGVMRLETDSGLCDVNVDVAAALAMAIHLGLPIYMEGDQVLAERKLRAIQGLTDSPASTQIPDAFREVIEGLDFPSHSDE